MIQKILFSPIGGSDPVNALYDGAWIHCCRHFQPDLTVVYLSAQMVAREKKHFFSGTLIKLNQWLGKEIIFEKEERPNLENPQDFEAFYDDFEGILARYHRQYPDAEILVNVSSGTPAMKGCLIHLYHMLPFKVKLIQVFGPHDEMGLNKGKRCTVSDDYDVDDGWVTDLDNEEGADNRCHILKDQQQAMRLKVMQIKTLVLHNEYSAALTLAKDPDMESYLPDRLIKALEAAKCRAQLDLYQASLLFNGFQFEDANIIRAHYKELLYQGAEMLLTMENDLLRDDIASCLRKITPVLFSLIIECANKYGLDILSFSDDEWKYIYKSKLAVKYPAICKALGSQLFKNAKHPDTAIMDNANLMQLLEQKWVSNDPICKNIEYLRKIEKEIRVDVAHKPVKMTQDVFRKKATCEMSDMLKIARKTFELLNPSLLNKAYWQSYERMNQMVLETIIAEKN